MRHPTQASLMSPAQAEALYDLALERECNESEPDQIVSPADRTSSTATAIISSNLTAGSQSSGVAKPGQVPRTVLSENPALPPNVRQTNR
jgi:hypothetical protein